MLKPLKQKPGVSRIACALVAAALVAAGCGAPEAKKPAASDSGAAVPDKPSSPQTINVMDVAGNLQLTQPILDDFQKAHPEIVTKIVTTKATAPELAPKIKAEQAAKMNELAQGQCVTITAYPSGPEIEYNPKTVTNPPTTAEALLEYAKTHPKKVEWAQPRNSGPARTLLMGMPYILGDKDPKDPVNGWEKTWAYMADIAQYQPAFPGGTTQTMKDLANGTVDIIATTTGWDINPRALGTVPAEMKVAQLKGFKWVWDAHYVCVPNGASADKLSAILQLTKFMLDKKEQAHTFDKGYFYPGPAVKDVTIDMAPQASQDVIKQFGRPEYDDLIKNTPWTTSLPAEAQVTAFDTWDKKVGAVAKK